VLIDIVMKFCQFIFLIFNLTLRYEINDVIPPDEYHDNVNNSVYTNVVCKLSLEFASEVVVW
jgi:trehalose/maltose hydrolase-like predicted phosphorylase